MLYHDCISIFYVSNTLDVEQSFHGFVTGSWLQHALSFLKEKKEEEEKKRKNQTTISMRSKETGGSTNRTDPFFSFLLPLSEAIEWLWFMGAKG